MIIDAVKLNKDLKKPVSFPLLKKQTVKKTVSTDWNMKIAPICLVFVVVVLLMNSQIRKYISCCSLFARVTPDLR